MLLVLAAVVSSRASLQSGLFFSLVGLTPPLILIGLWSDGPFTLAEGLHATAVSR